MATDFVKKWQTSHFRRCGIQKRNGISVPQCARYSAIDACISCENLVKFGHVTPELTGLICERLVRHGQKLTYFVKYLRTYWIDFHNLYTI